MTVLPAIRPANLFKPEQQTDTFALPAFKPCYILQESIKHKSCVPFMYARLTQQALEIVAAIKVSKHTSGISFSTPTPLLDLPVPIHIERVNGALLEMSCGVLQHLDISSYIEAQFCLIWKWAASEVIMHVHFHDLDIFI